MAATGVVSHDKDGQAINVDLCRSVLDFRECIWRQTEGGEGILLDQLAAQGLHCDSSTQLVVVCEVTPLLPILAKVCLIS